MNLCECLCNISRRRHDTIRSLSYKVITTWYSNLVQPKQFHPPYLHIVQIGDPTLRVVCDTIPKESMKSDYINSLINRMKKVFKKFNCVGLSAPQIGVPLRLLMFEYNEKHAKYFSLQERKNRQIKLHPFTVIINPEVKITDYTQVVFPELCESIKGFCADVPRYKALEIKGVDENGDFLQLNLDGWNARIVQHEMDHLNGILYTDIMDRKSLICSCWQVVNQRRGKVELPYGAS